MFLCFIFATTGGHKEGEDDGDDIDEHKMISGHYHQMLDNAPHNHEDSHGSIDDKFHYWMNKARNYHKVKFS